MDYLVSIENRPYFHWQLELLIESFRLHNLQDKLLIAVADGDKELDNYYLPNFHQHERKFQHNNFGKESNCLVANKIYAVITALENKFLSDPFVLIHPDMLLMQPFDFESDANILFHKGDYPSIPEIQPLVDELTAAKFEGIEGDDKVLPELPVGGVIRLQDVPPVFYDRVLERLLYLSERFPNQRFVERAAWILTMYEFLGRLVYETNNFELALMNHDAESYFVHYKYGMPPLFNKREYTFDDNMISTGADPYHTLLQNSDTSVMEYVHKVIESYNLRE